MIHLNKIIQLMAGFSSPYICWRILYVLRPQLYYEFFQLHLIGHLFIALLFLAGGIYGIVSLCYRSCDHLMAVCFYFTAFILSIVCFPKERIAFVVIPILAIVYASAYLREDECSECFIEETEDVSVLEQKAT